MEMNEIKDKIDDIYRHLNHRTNYSGNFPEVEAACINGACRIVAALIQKEDIWDDEEEEDEDTEPYRRPPPKPPALYDRNGKQWPE